jgi:hypothetical protein
VQNYYSGCVSIFISVFLIFVLLMGGTGSISQNQTAVTNLPAPTPIPTATFPAPIADLETVSFETIYDHPSGLFSVAQPTGWELGSPISDADRVAITMFDNDQLSVVEIAVERSEQPITTMDALDAYFDEAYLDSSWVNYGDWSETDRRIEDDKLLIDFDLRFNRQPFLARQVSWYSDDEWIINVRVVVPGNAADELNYILNGVVDSLRMTS